MGIVITKEVEIELEDDDLDELRAEILDDLRGNEFHGVLDNMKASEIQVLIGRCFTQISSRHVKSPIIDMLRDISEWSDSLQDSLETCQAIMEHAMDACERLKERLSKQEVAR